MKFDRLLACCGALPVLLAIASGASAQTMPFEEARKPPLPVPHATPVLPVPADGPPLTLKSNETLFVRSFRIDGPDLGAPGEVSATLAPYENRKLTLTQIYEAADKVTQLYRMKGYMVGKVYVPAQDARGGVLRLKAVPGGYGKVTVINHAPVLDPLVRAAMTPPEAKAGTYVMKDGLERSMLLTSDLAGVGIPKIALAPGQKPETADLTVDVPAGERISGYLTGDNYGAPSTGRNQLSGAVNINSPFGLGDRISVWGQISQENDLKNGSFDYSVPLGVDGVRAGVSVFRTTYALGAGFSDIGATGTVDGVSATLSYALKRQADESYWISGTFMHKKVTDKVFDGAFDLNDRNINYGQIQLKRHTNGTAFGLPLMTQANLFFTEGHVEFPDPVNAALNPDGVGGYYSRLNLDYLAILGITDKLSFSTTVRGQAALGGKTLDSSEQFFLTGFFGVRSFDQGFAGDSGYLVTPELKYALPGFMGYTHAVGVFTDVGGAWLEHPVAGGLQKGFTQLNDVGIGYYATYEYLPNKFVLLKAQLAHSYGGTDIGAVSYDKGTKGLLQVGFTF